MKHIITGIAAAVFGGVAILAADARRRSPPALTQGAAPAALALPPPAQQEATKTKAAQAQKGGAGLWAGPTASANLAADASVWAGVSADARASSENLWAGPEASASGAVPALQAVALPPPLPAGLSDTAALWSRATPGQRQELLGMWPSASDEVSGGDKPTPGGGDSPPIVQPPTPGPEWS
ncbi:hypothetical protein ACLEPN_22015 [Myxococcus sp. 1LA]